MPNSKYTIKIDCLGHDVIAFDHCHTHGHFRGWLCDRCNTTLGAVQDKPDLLRKMADYLERTSPKVAS